MRMQLNNGFPHPSVRGLNDEEVEHLVEESHARTLNIGGVRCVMYGTDLMIKFNDEAWMNSAKKRTGWPQAANDENVLVAQLNCRDGAHSQIMAAGFAWSEFKVCSSWT